MKANKENGLNYINISVRDSGNEINFSNFAIVTKVGSEHNKPVVFRYIVL